MAQWTMAPRGHPQEAPTEAPADQALLAPREHLQQTPLACVGPKGQNPLRPLISWNLQVEQDQLERTLGQGQPGWPGEEEIQVEELARWQQLLRWISG